jgi:hypothetical protein
MRPLWPPGSARGGAGCVRRSLVPGCFRDRRPLVPGCLDVVGATGQAVWRCALPSAAAFSCCTSSPERTHARRRSCRRALTAVPCTAPCVNDVRARMIAAAAVAPTIMLQLFGRRPFSPHLFFCNAAATAAREIWAAAAAAAVVKRRVSPCAWARQPAMRDCPSILGPRKAGWRRGTARSTPLCTQRHRHTRDAQICHRCVAASAPVVLCSSCGVALGRLSRQSRPVQAALVAAASRRRLLLLRVAAAAAAAAVGVHCRGG